MLTFLEAFLGYKESPLAPAMKAMLEVRRPAGQTKIGLGWLLNSTDGKEIAWHNGGTGGFRSFVGYDPKERIGVVVLSNASTLTGVDDIGLHLLNPKLPLANPEPPKQHTEIPIDPKLLDNYTGRYQVTPDRILEITRDGDRLFAQVFAQANGQPIAGPKFEMFAESEKNFFAKVAGGQITFETGPEGRATSLIMHRAGRDPCPAPDCPDSRFPAARVIARGWHRTPGESPAAGPKARPHKCASCSGGFCRRWMRSGLWLRFCCRTISVLGWLFAQRSLVLMGLCAAAPFSRGSAGVWLYDDVVEASGSLRQPPSVKLQIDFDLQFGPPFPDKYQEDEQHQKVHK